MTHYFGAHIKFNDDDLVAAAKSIKKAGGNLMQVMLTNPAGGTKAQKPEQINELVKYLKENDIKIVVHSSYIHNFARKWDQYSWWVKNLQLEIEYAHQLGAKAIVLHFGNRTYTVTKKSGKEKVNITLQQAYNNMYTSLAYVHMQTEQFKDVKICLETPAGAGSIICSTFEELGHFYSKFSKSENKELKKRIKLCLDTCHIFAAGYDIRTKENVETFLLKFEKLVGIQYIYIIHLNDSNVELDDKVDRHANIGKGYIGETGLVHIFKYFRKLGVPIILETPNKGYETEIRQLLSN
jgi:deoxyribonuclease-4